MKKYIGSFKRMTNTAEKTYSKHLYTHEDLLQDLKNNLVVTRNRIQTIQRTFNTCFPDIVFDEHLIKILFTFSTPVEHLIFRLKVEKAQSLGLNCMYGENLLAAPASVADDRKLVEAMAAADLRVLESIRTMLRYRTEETKNLLTYIRSGAIYVGSKNEVCISFKAAELLKEYCSVDIKTAEEEKFYKSLLSYVDFIRETEKAHLDLIKTVGNKELAADLSELTYQYGQIRLSTGFCVSSDSFLWRAMLNYSIVNRKDDTAHFYNKVGLINEYDAEDVYKATGYRPEPTAGLRVRYPNLYKDVPFREDDNQSGNLTDTKGLYEELLASKEQVDNIGICRRKSLEKPSVFDRLGCSMRRM